MGTTFEKNSVFVRGMINKGKPAKRRPVEKKNLLLKKEYILFIRRDLQRRLPPSGRRNVVFGELLGTVLEDFGRLLGTFGAHF